MTSYYDDICRPVATLEKGLNITELLRNHETEFELKPDDDEEESLNAEMDFNFEEAQQKLVKLDLLEVDESEDGIGTPFDKYSKKMTDITEDGKLKKFIVRNGAGDFVPNNGLVYVNYQAYVEYAETPFDSTLMQNNETSDIVKYDLSKGDIIIGLHRAILTMRKGEKAEFLIHHDLAYGKLGCPPRIPPEATVLFVVEMDRYVDCSEAFDSDDDDVAPEERNKFEQVNKKARALNKIANEYFKNQNYSQAVIKYKIITNMLHHSRTANDEEEKDRNKFLMRVYSNSCICYDKLKQPKKVCTVVNEAIKVDRKEALNHAKLMYFWGRAKMILCDYQSARKHLMAAQKLVPRDKLIGDAILELQRRESNSKAQEKIMWQKGCNFQSFGTSVKIRELTKEEEDFREIVVLQLTEFKASNDREWTLTRQFTTQEETTLLQVAKDLQLYARVADNERRIIQIKKPDDY